MWSSSIVILLEFFSQRSNHILHSLQQASSIKKKQINIRVIKLRCISAARSWCHTNNTVVLTILDHSVFPAYLMFTFYVCWGSVGARIFGNSSSAANNTWSRLLSRLSFRFLWLCSFIVKQLFVLFEVKIRDFTLEEFSKRLSLQVKYVKIWLDFIRKHQNIGNFIILT